MFKIQTLSDNNNNSLKDIFAIIPYVISFVANLFGSPQRRELTSSDWNYLVPFTGTLYNNIKSNLSSRIKYDVDLPNMALFVLAYAVTNGSNFGYPNTDQGHQAFYNELSNERLANGVPSINVNIPSNMVSASDVSSYDQKYISQFATYFYGNGTQLGTTIPTGTNGIPKTTNQILSGFDTSNIGTFLLIGAFVYFVSQSKGK